MSNEVEHIHTLIIGSGPAGYTAAIYAARADLKPVMYTGLQPGGQLTTTTEVENFPGYPEGTQGPEMMEDFKKQAERFGTEVRFGIVTAVDFSSLPHKVTLDDGKTVTADAVIISTGASAKWLGLPSEQKYNGFGVSACAVCDGFFFRKQDVAIVGAGDTAAEEATYLAKLCQKVYMIVRKGEMRASKAMQHRVLNTPNIEVLYHSETKEILGDGQNVTGALIVNNETGEEKTIDITGFFVAIGHKPNTDVFKGWLDMDENGYIITQPGSTKTNVEGVFAAGDVQDHIYRQAVTAAGSGCMAALDAERYIAAKEHSSVYAEDLSN
ncbi:thioredoxin-disulfide reductase [Solitalea canadensis]|uniref:Thioredoxin reductase n=1 Tax=Solitalea canadensis (strain ATCC 29591 / DSM 3403 / JCM 21819 / LMG 8368 / NBRC 15130 / NCIMB 12057 / USAM 9D) TaxID=929556 RepID=H8KVF8_SOLCM|nr:thioredoxin-disulfide reductase [Solitalea canadensis]AFD06338.1 thioredoxin-disulfide reductase [Solitalea canadensis DSM 3403]